MSESLFSYHSTFSHSFHEYILNSCYMADTIIRGTVLVKIDIILAFKELSERRRIRKKGKE